jgi:ADYC domain-containing protein
MGGDTMPPARERETMTRTTWGWTCAALVLAGCAAGEAPVATALATRLAGCEDFLCGTNSPAIAGRRFYELNLDGQWNSELVALDRSTGIHDGRNRLLELEVRGDAVHGKLNGTPLLDKELVGTTLPLFVKNDRYDLIITDVSRTPYWIESQPRTVPIFKIVYVPHGDDLTKAVALCSDPVADDAAGITGWAVIFNGDRYDATSKTVTETGLSSRWFNIGCAGSPTAKMHFLGHTLAARDASHSTAPAERQAVLKMLAADYCGSGDGFTVPGVRIRTLWNQPWQTQLPFHEDGWDHFQREASWTADGAVCLDTPRLRHWPDAAGPDTWPQVVAECNRVGRAPPPPCKGPYPELLPIESGYLMSAGLL